MRVPWNGVRPPPDDRSLPFIWHSAALIFQESQQAVFGSSGFISDHKYKPFWNTPYNKRRIQRMKLRAISNSLPADQVVVVADGNRKIKRIIRPKVREQGQVIDMQVVRASDPVRVPYQIWQRGFECLKFAANNPDMRHKVRDVLSLGSRLADLMVNFRLPHASMISDDVEYACRAHIRREFSQHISEDDKATITKLPTKLEMNPTITKVCKNPSSMVKEIADLCKDRKVNSHQTKKSLDPNTEKILKFASANSGEAETDAERKKNASATPPPPIDDNITCDFLVKFVTSYLKFGPNTNQSVINQDQATLKVKNIINKFNSVLELASPKRDWKYAASMIFSHIPNQEQVLQSKLRSYNDQILSEIGLLPVAILAIKAFVSVVIEAFYPTQAAALDESKRSIPPKWIATGVDPSTRTVRNVGAPTLRWYLSCMLQTILDQLPNSQDFSLLRSALIMCDCEKESDRFIKILSGIANGKDYAYLRLVEILESSGIRKSEASNTSKNTEVEANALLCLNDIHFPFVINTVEEEEHVLVSVKELIHRYPDILNDTDVVHPIIEAFLDEKNTPSLRTTPERADMNEVQNSELSKASMLTGSSPSTGSISTVFYD